LIGLQNLGISTPLSADSRRQDEPPLLVLGPLQSRALDSQAIVDLFLKLLRFRRASPPHPFFPLLAGLNPLAEGMITPGPWPAASPPLAVAFIVGESGFRIGGTGKPSRLDASDVLGYPLGLVGLRFAIRQGCLLGQPGLLQSRFCKEIVDK